eukprot:14561201-Alexandrium_andersonii.AAC.1
MQRTPEGPSQQPLQAHRAHRGDTSRRARETPSDATMETPKGPRTRRSEVHQNNHRSYSRMMLAVGVWL